MKPSVGRIVHLITNNGEIHAAIICYVHSDTCVNLAVFDVNGNHRHETSVSFNPENKPGTWNWPPRV